MKTEHYDEVLSYLASVTAALSLTAMVSALMGRPSDVLVISTVVLLSATGLFGLFAERN